MSALAALGVVCLAGGVAALLWGRICRARSEPATGDDAVELTSFVHINSVWCGKDVKVVGNTVSGSGCAVANTSLHQTKSYFEIKIKTSGTIMIGVTAKPSDALDVSLKGREQTWFLDCSSQPAGVVLGLSLDLATVRPGLAFYANGAPLPQPARQTVRGDVYPVLYCADGAVVETNFGTATLAHLPPGGFEGLMCSIDLL